MSERSELQQHGALAHWRHVIDDAASDVYDVMVRQ
jgi:hypothetical protein